MQILLTPKSYSGKYPAFLLVLLFSLLSLLASAGTDPVAVSVLEGSKNGLKKDSTRETFDPIFYSANKIYIADTSKDVYRNSIALLIDEESETMIDSNFTVTVWVKIFWTAMNGNQDSLTKILEIDYKVAGGTPYNARNYFYFDKARRVRMRVDSVDLHGNAWDATQVLLLENRMEVKRDYIFSCATSPNTINHSITDITSEGKFDELVLTWSNDPFLGITHYDVEWSWVDFAALDRYKTGGNFDAKLLFRNNATRVTIPGSSVSYKVPLIYDGTGRLFYRVRPVHFSEDGQIMEGTWSGNASNFTNFYEYTNGHESDLNWQVSTTYAEDGKRKTVIQYFDGTLRSRQTVTKDNVNNNTIVAETLYDYQGRPAINILPAPTLNTVIEYAENFNRFIGAAGDPKAKYDLVPVGQTICTSVTPGLDNNYGASKYYSANNPRVSEGINKFIPDAANYPYAETRYVPDATGRIAAQSGVGPAFQLSSNHETKYYYGYADQKELNALFGTEVGEQSHYFKNMVRDANGQYSVSYVDMHGRTIATALAGTPPANVKGLDSYDPQYMTKNLLGKGNNIVKGRSIESSTTLLVPKAGLHEFHYELSPQSAEIIACNPAGQTVCYDCYYDLEIRITGTCGQTPIVITRRNFTFGSYDASCVNPSPSLVVDESYTLEEGEYNITKKLTLSKDAQDWYRENVYAQKNICKTLQDFYDELYAILEATNNCNISCSECNTALGSLGDYRTRFLQSQGIDPLTTVPYEAEIVASYNEALASCEALCSTPDNKLSGIRQQLLDDMTPGEGQYAVLTPTEQKPLNIFLPRSGEGSEPFRNPRDANGNGTTGFPDGSGIYNQSTVPPLNDPLLTPEQFTSQFGAKWADALLYYHPEYCKLKAAEQYLATSYSWDQYLENIDTWQDAQTNGYLSGVSILDHDPFFNNPAYASYRSIISSRINGNYRNTGKSMWQLAMISVHCLNRNDAACINSFAAAPPYDLTSCSGDWNHVWRIFRSMYLSEKDRLINQFLDAQCNGINYQLLSDHHYQRRFGSVDVLSGDFATIINTLQGFIDNGSNPQGAGDIFASGQMQQQYEANCDGYIEAWKSKLLTCDVIYNHSQRESILTEITNKLKAVCVRGSDIDHPFGSSTVKPTDNLSPRSFEEVIAAVLAARGISITTLCHPYLIDYPKPYENPQPLADEAILEQKDDCVCDRITELEQEKIRLQFNGTLSAFISYQYGVDIRQSLLIDTLKAGCLAEPGCILYDPGMIIPAILGCHSSLKNCIDCDAYNKLKAEFLSLYPSYAVLYEMPATDEEADRNVLFEKFMNSRTGLSKSWLEYLQFEKACAAYTEPWTCKQLKDIVAAFYAANPNPGTGSSCRALFVSFFNTQTGGSYTFAQIQDLFLTYCGELPDVCEPVLDCKTLDNLIKDFYATYGVAISTAGNCQTLFTSYFNTHFGTNYTWTQIADMAKKVCGYPLNVCYKYSIEKLQSVIDNWFSCQNNAWMNGSCLSQWVTYFNGATGDTLDADEIEALYQQNNIALQPCLPPLDAATLQNLLHAYNNAGAAACPGGSTECHNCFTKFINETLGRSFSYEQIILMYKKATGTDPAVCEAYFNAKALTDFSNNYIQTNAGSYANCDSLFTAAFDTAFGVLYTYEQVMAVYQLYTDGKPEVCRKETLLSCPQLQTVRNSFMRLYPDPAKFFGVPHYKTAFRDYFNQATGDTLSYDAIWLYYGTLCGIELDLAADSTICTKRKTILDNYLSNYGLLNLPQALCRDLFTHLYNQAFANETPYDWTSIKAQYDSCGIPFTLCPADSSTVLLACYKLPAAVKAIRALYDNRLPEDCNKVFTNFFNQYYLSSFTSYQQLADWAKDNCGINLDLCGLADTVRIVLRSQPTATPPVSLPPRLCSTLPLFPTLVSEPEDPCSFNTTLALNAATEQYHAYVQIKKDDFDKEYQNKCLEAANLELFTVRSQVAEYHYTLYYYDQAGSLVKTVPPAGVHPDFTTTFYNNVEAARATGHSASPVVPAHTLTTEYRYNTLGQVIQQKSPDGGLSKFWYDELGRLVISQNAKQQGNNQYSYTKYDELGRITEVGQLTSVNGITQAIAQDKDDLAGWISAVTNSREQITTTVYDYPEGALCGSTSVLCQQNLRNRVSFTTFTDLATDNAYASATYYTYDIHGNVDILLQHYNKGILQTVNGNAFKKITYKYDLVSGKVNEVAYQPGVKDQFYHRYEYDAENKLTEAWTSHDHVYWEKQAAYTYYRHGPLARTELGQLGVQGIDYAYTLQGWLKGMNTTAIVPGTDAGGGFDMGGDGATNTRVAKDALGFSLNYYRSYVDANSVEHTDYKSINSGVTPFTTIVNGLPQVSGDGVVTGKDLFNGNIRAMLVNIPQLSTTSALEGVKLYGYQYDQLNRITAMNGYNGLTASSNSFSASAITDYKERISYDPNGNILSYLRNGTTAGGSPLAMDDMSYNYYSGTNRLRHVDDAVSAGNYSTDIDDQAADNYTYDAIGNLTGDVAEGIGSIEWTVYGKIKKITKTSGVIIEYRYDDSGNRIEKKVTPSGIGASPKFTAYVRDASGNVMAIYENGNSELNSGRLTQTELHLYGSSRLGLWKANRDVEVSNWWLFSSVAMTGTSGGATETFTRGRTIYELSNHLGNVLATVSDHKIAVPASGQPTQVSHYLADVLTANDYYPFGSLMPGRKFSADGTYRYGFNGKENDNDVKGEGNQQDYGMRIYDPRLGKFLSVDPIAYDYPELSPYQFAGNTPIQAIDLDGLEPAYSGYKADGTYVSYGPGDNLRRVVPIDERHLLPKPPPIDPESVSMLLDYIPIVGQIKAVYEGVTGEDPITGRKLSPLERTMNLMPSAKQFRNIKNVTKSADKAKDASKAANSANRVSKSIPPGLCFASGTKILTINGLINIENIKIGDSVWSFSDKSKVLGINRVSSISKKITNQFVRIYLDSICLLATPDHPFWLENKWVEAKNLQKGESLKSFNGRHVIIDSLSIQDTLATVYNFEVENYHTYFVSSFQILVHNNDICQAPKPIKYVLKPSDLDWRGTGKNFKEALEEAFRRTGLKKGDFEVTKWGKDKNGKSMPVEYRAKNGAEVNVDLAHKTDGPDAPHVGYQTGGKRNSGGGIRGHILLDDVPVNR